MNCVELFKRIFLPVRCKTTSIPGQIHQNNADKGDPVTMVRVHVGLDLEHKTGKFIVGWLNDLVITSLMSSGFRRILQIRLQERFDPEIGEGGPKILASCLPPLL